jgi:hypothetical protein
MTDPGRDRKRAEPILPDDRDESIPASPAAHGFA